jgi:hypothetical protein
MVQPTADPEKTEDPERAAASADAVSVEAVRELAEDETLEPARRRKLLGRLALDQRRVRGLRDAFNPRAVGRWMSDALTDIVPHLPVRDLDTLRRHYDGLDGEELAARLVRNAARVTAGIGATSGGVAAVEWIATPTLLSTPVLLAVETVAVVAVEVKLIGELHEVYRRPVRGSGTERALALIQAWAQRRGVNPMAPGGGITAVLGTAGRRELRERLLKRLGRNLSTVGPMLTGAAVAGFLNRRATQQLGQEIRKDLRGRKALPPAP